MTGGTSEVATQTSRRRADIQGLRALAVLLVVLYHAGLGFSGGFVGVDVFFVISGFVITAMLLGELGSSDTIKLARFYLRRIRRLVPALALLVVVIALVSIVAAPVGVQPIAARTGAAAQVFLGNVYLYGLPRGYFALDTTTNPFLHTWSLAVEEQFYLVFPLVLLGAWRIGRPSGRSRVFAVAALTVVGIASFAFAVALTRPGATFPGIAAPKEFAFYSSITRAWEFAAGALLAFGVQRLRTLPAVVASILGWIGTALVVGVALRYDALTAFPGINAVPPVLGTALIIAAGVGGVRGVGHVLSTRPAVFIGDISYSWYLWHWPFIVFARALWPGSFAAPVAAALSIIPAWISYHFVENPIRRNDRLTASRTLTFAGVAIVLGIGCTGLLDLGHRAVIRSDGYHSVTRAQRTHRACPNVRQAIRNREPLDPRISLRCTWSVTDPKGTIALVGDSNAGHISEPVVHAGRGLGYDVYRAGSNGCPFVDVTMVVERVRRADCRHFFEGSLRALTRLRPELVVIGSTTTRYLDEKQFGLIVGAEGPVATSRTAKTRAWEAGMRRVVTRLSRAGIDTVVVHPVPKYPGWDLRGCAAGRVVLAQFTCGRDQSLSSARAFLADAVAAEERAIDGVRGASAVSFLPQLCSRSTCSTDRDAVWVYHDGDHLSIAGSLELEPRFEALFRARLGLSSS